MRDYPVASDLSQQVLEARRLRGELGAQVFDSSYRRLYAVPGNTGREFIADPDLGNHTGTTDSDDCEQVRLSQARLTPTWHVHRRRG